MASPIEPRIEEFEILGFTSLLDLPEVEDEEEGSLLELEALFLWLVALGVTEQTDPWNVAKRCCVDREQRNLTDEVSTEK